MRVPVITATSLSVQGPAVQGPGPAPVREDTSVARSLVSLGEGLGRAAAGWDKAAQARTAELDKAKEEATSLVLAESDLDLELRYQKRLFGDGQTEGFLSTRGKSAWAASGDLLAQMATDRQEVAGSISDPRARNRFLIRSAEKYASAARQAEQHTGREFETAKADTVKGLELAHYAAIESGGFTDPSDWALSKGNVESHLRALATSPEAATAAVTEFRARDAMAYTKGLLARGELATAEAYVKGRPGDFGTSLDEARAAVDAKLAASKKDLANAAVAESITAATTTLRDENGFVTEARLRQAVAQRPPGDPLRDEQDAALERQVRIEREKLDAAVKQHENAAKLAALVDGRPIPAESEAFLRKYDPTALVAIKSEQRTRARQWKAEKDGSARERAEARRTQALLDLEAQRRFATELVTNPKADREEWLKGFIAEKAEAGIDATVSDAARAAMGLDRAKAEKTAGTVESREESAITTDLDRELRGVMRKKGGKVNEALLQERVGKGILEYRRRVAAGGGKPLDEAAVAKLKHDALMDVVTEVGVFRDTKAPAVDTWGADAGVPAPAPAPPPAAAAPSKAEALRKWAARHPGDPRSAAILKKLGAM